MKQHEVQIGQTYTAKVSNKLTKVQITGVSPYGGWDATNVATGRTIHIKSAMRLRAVAAAKGKTKKPPVAPPELATQSAEPTSPTPPECAPATVEPTTPPQEEVAPAVEEAPTTDFPAVETPPMESTATEATSADTPAPANPPRKKTPREDGTMSGLDAAAKVLVAAATPLNAKQILERIQAQGLWKTEGKTPHSTLYAAIIREISLKGDNSRFRKAERGKFTA